MVPCFLRLMGSCGKCPPLQRPCWATGEASCTHKSSDTIGNNFQFFGTDKVQRIYWWKRKTMTCAHQHRIRQGLFPSRGADCPCQEMPATTTLSLLWSEGQSVLDQKHPDTPSRPPMSSSRLREDQQRQMRHHWYSQCRCCGRWWFQAALAGASLLECCPLGGGIACRSLQRQHSSWGEYGWTESGQGQRIDGDKALMVTTMEKMCTVLFYKWQRSFQMTHLKVVVVGTNRQKKKHSAVHWGHIVCLKVDSVTCDTSVTRYFWVIITLSPHMHIQLPMTIGIQFNMVELTIIS